MKKFLRLIFIVVLGIAAFFVIQQKTAKTEEPVRIANPASIYCLDNGGSLEIVTEKDGGQIGMCTLVDGTTCEERAYFRGECPSENIDKTNTIIRTTHQGYITQVYTNGGINYLNIDYTEDGPEGDGGAPEIINNNPMIRTFAIDTTATFKVLKYVSGGPELMNITRNEFQARGSRTRAENNLDMDNPIYYGAGDYSIVVIEHDDQKVYTITETYRP